MKKLNRKFKMQNNKLTVVEVAKTASTLEIINGVKTTIRHSMSSSAHTVISKAITRPIHETSFIVKGIVLRAAQNKETGKIYAYGVLFNTKGGNSPYVRALVKENGDMDKVGVSEVKLHHWDRENKELVPEYTVRCNDKDAKSLNIETNAISIVDFSQLASDLSFICSDQEAIETEKNNIINNVLSAGIEVKKDGRVYIARDKVAYDSLHFNLISWSPSNERSETAIFTSLDPSVAFRIIDLVSGGALSAAVCRERSVKELKKFSKRLGQLGAPSTETVRLGNSEFGCMIYMKETEGPSDYMDSENQKLLDAGIEIDRNTYDGSVVYSAAFLRKVIEQTGKRVSEKQSVLFAAQTRANVLFTKVFGEGKSHRNMKFRRDRYLAIVPEERTLIVDAGTDVSHLNKDDYDLIIVGNKNNIGMILDINGGKALKDIPLQLIVDGNYMNYLLDVAKCSETETSGQMLQKFISIDKNATTKALMNLITNEFNTTVDDYLLGDINAKECSLAQFIMRYTENGILNEEALRSLISNELVRTESQLKKFRIKVDAVYLRALFDDAYFMTDGKIDGVLGANKYTGRLEAYSYDVELRYKDQIDAIYADDSIVDKDEALAKLLTGVAFKYPSPSADENAIMTFLTSRQLVERIANMDNLTIKEREILIDDFVNTSFGVIKMAPNNTVKHRLAGMDTDFDGVAVVFEKELVDIVVNNYSDNDGFTVKKSV